LEDGSVSFSIRVSKSQLADIEKKIAKKLASAAVVKEIQNQILSMPSIRAWLRFLGSTDFVTDFGVPTNIAARMRAQFAQEVGRVKVVKSKGSVSYQAIDENNLRAITSWGWGALQLNAWDAYEYGIIGGRRSRGISGYHIDRTLSTKERKFSRSGGALMKRGGSFKLHTGQAPPVFGVRSAFVTSAERFADSIRKKVVL
jgi:hypothetical protein